MTAEKAHLGRWRQRARRPPAVPRPAPLRADRRRARARGQPCRRRRSAPRSTARRRGPPDEPATARRAGEPRILFATSNGTGLGHLNRAMAIARRLPPGLELVVLHALRRRPGRRGRGLGRRLPRLLPPPGVGHRPGLEPAALRAMLEQVLAERAPDLVVFDGVHPYRALTHVLSARGAPPSIWCRRPMWRPDSAAAPLRPRRRLRRGPRAGRARRDGRRRARPSAAGARRGGFARSSSSTATSCCRASGPRPSSGSTPPGAPRS